MEPVTRSRADRLASSDMEAGGRMTPEGALQARIEIALGAESDLILLRNTVGHVKYYDERTGEPRHVTFGLTPGSPDLVGILSGRWFCLEVKVPGEDADPHQAKLHGIWRRFGALVYVVHSVEEARAALVDARGKAS